MIFLLSADFFFQTYLFQRGGYQTVCKVYQQITKVVTNTKQAKCNSKAASVSLYILCERLLADMGTHHIIGRKYPKQQMLSAFVFC